jgi:hypothetical protein
MKHLYFAIAGLPEDLSLIDEQGSVCIHKVHKRSPKVPPPPSELEYIAIYGYYLLWYERINHEMVLRTDDLENNYELPIAELVFIMLRITTNLEFVCPYYSDTSWNVIMNQGSTDCNISVYDEAADVSNYTQTDEREPVVENFHEWIAKYMVNVVKINNNPKLADALGAAFYSIRSHYHITDIRHAVLALAMGFESLFGDTNTANYAKMSALVATYLYPAGPQRKETAFKVLEFLNLRNYVIHSKEVRVKLPSRKNADELINSIKYARRVLSLCIVKIIETMKLPDNKEILNELYDPKLD